MLFSSDDFLLEVSFDWLMYRESGNVLGFAEEILGWEFPIRFDYLYPSGTTHSSGKDNLVLEISSTPYIFTFKIYDWLRENEGGKPRPLNIDRPFDNLESGGQGSRIPEEFISTQEVLKKGDGWWVVYLPIHPALFYDVHRYEFRDSITRESENSFHVMNLVVGSR